jgi:hypothetical protein
MEAKETQKAVNLINQQRWAALATIKGEEPYASMVAYAASPQLDHLYLHLSTLAPHTKKLITHPKVALVISEPDTHVEDPQTLARITLQGKVEIIAKENDDYEEAKACYLKRLPNAEMLFEFSDFSLFRFTPEKLRYVGGFAKAFSLSKEALQAAIKN